jgi:hypothetical protein
MILVLLASSSQACPNPPRLLLAAVSAPPSPTSLSSLASPSELVASPSELLASTRPVTGTVPSLTTSPTTASTASTASTATVGGGFQSILPRPQLFRWGHLAVAPLEIPLAALVPLPLTRHQVRDAKSSLGDAKSSLGDAKSSLGDAKSSLGDAKS